LIQDQIHAEISDQKFRKDSDMNKLLAMIAVGVFSLYAVASDHDDGENDVKARALNITDVFAFNEFNQTGNPSDQGNLILIMNTNPRSLPGQMYFFSTKARYNFHLSRVPRDRKAVGPNGVEQIRFVVEFKAPNANGQQPIVLTFAKDGKIERMNASTDGAGIVTTPLAQSRAGQPYENKIRIGGSEISLFAGLREDPFFFDVEQFFKLRASALAGALINPVLLPPSQAKDFAHNYNVNAIVLRVPIQMLQNSGENVFDVWTTISIPRGAYVAAQ
jgi:hypothetical protein